jgi:hypothetical protein
VETNYKKPNSNKKLKIHLLGVLLGMMGGELEWTPLKVSIIKCSIVQLAPPLVREYWECPNLAVYKSTHCGHHAYPKMNCTDLIHLRIGIYLDNYYWWIHIRYL